MCFSLRNWFWLTISWPPFPEESVTLPIWRTLGSERTFSHTFLRKLVRSRCLVWCSVSGQSTYHRHLFCSSVKATKFIWNFEIRTAWCEACATGTVLGCTIFILLNCSGKDALFSFSSISFSFYFQFCCRKLLNRHQLVMVTFLISRFSHNFCVICDSTS